jgi:hypothetical protein
MMELEGKIKELLQNGLSFLQIANELGVTRGTVAGRITRMRQRGEIDNTYKPTDGITVPPDKDVGGIHLLDLKEDDCRFPIGETIRGIFFCGEPRRDARTRYCAKHHTIVWVKGSAPNDRKPKR